MALLTSLYLCSRTVYAAVGTPTGSGARVVAAAQTELPEGCLINGVITNEADLAEALAAKGVEIDRRAIVVEPIKTVGEYEAVAKLHREVRATIRFSVNAAE